MNIIALDSSGLVASVALVEEDRVVAEYTMNNKQTHSQTMLPMLDEIVKASGISKSDIDAIAISRGPGSFTGLRIGSATAKGLGLALNIPLIEIPTLEALAYNLFVPGSRLICPIMDARRQEVYSGVYEIGTEAGVYPVKTVVEESAGPLSNLITKLNNLGREVIFVGDAVPVYKDLIAEGMKVPYYFAPAHLSRQRAAAVGMLGTFRCLEGKTVKPEEHAPVYLRVSQAEREAGGK